MGKVMETIFKSSMINELKQNEDRFDNLPFETSYTSQELVPRSPPGENPPELEKIGSYSQEFHTTRESLRKKSKRIITSISSVFPFELFPSTIEVEDNKVTVIFRQFFWCSQTQSMDMQDISNTFIETAPFFATLRIITRSFVENSIKIPWLKRGEATHTRNIIEGLRIFSQERIDTSKYELKDLIKKLDSLSTINIRMHRG
ncbi:MAG TPA: hypothetical protein VLF89_05865 [Candidatus Saccharimonadales bacterium]|nr:hypothetical protein [Candidatus Saccharimonadales bacterium]